MPENVKMGLHRLELMVCLFLIVATLAVYWQVRNHGFVNYDDDSYVTENPHVQAGLTCEGIIWAFTTTHASNWHPLTWLSHMLDCQLYGLNPGRHHFTSILLHIANALLLFGILIRMTGALWRSAFVAALFALHPVHVESVAWVAERKDVLSTLFWMLTMGSYVRYVERPGLNRYLLALLFFALGLMAKPMVVTLPFVLLLADYWPLGRFEKVQSARETLLLVREKVPFFALSAVSSVVTFLAQQEGGTVASLEFSTLKIRIANALVSYMGYIGKTIWPHHLAVLYPHPGNSLPMWQAAGAGLLLVSISVMVIRAARQFPYVAVGWLWYLGTLAPVIGVVQVGSQSMADRYTYVPLIGLFVIIAWGAPGLVARWRYRRILLATSTWMVLSAFVISARLQTQYWENDLTLFQRAVDVTVDNYVAHNNLGNALAEQGKSEEAIVHYSEAVRIKPNYADAHYNLGNALAEQGRFEQAIAHYSEAVRLRPDHAEAHNDLGVALAEQGKFPEAIANYFEALRIRPDCAEAHNNLGIALAKQGKLEQATACFSEAVRIRPDYAEAHNDLGVALAGQRKYEEAIAHFSEALRIRPDYVGAKKNLRLVTEMLGRTGKGTSAVVRP